MNPTRYPLIFFLLLAITACRTSQFPEFSEDFDNIHDRVWVGAKYAAIPLEDWQVHNGRLECMGKRTRMRVNLLTHALQAEGNFEVQVKMGLLAEGKRSGSAGISLGIYDSLDSSIPALCYYGKGIAVGIDTEGSIFIGDSVKMLPENFDINSFDMVLKGQQLPGKAYELWVQAVDHTGTKSPVVLAAYSAPIEGLIALVNNHRYGADYAEGPRFWFDDWKLSGDKFVENSEHAWGPILWSMHTLSRNTLKLTAQMPPLGEQDAQEVELQTAQAGKWQTLATERIDPDARTALFRIPDWNTTEDVAYRLVYNEQFPDGSTQPHYYEGTIRKPPMSSPLKLAGLTCQYNTGYPYTPVVDNLTQENPDMLFFSGDQLYEGNGGYGIIRFPADSAILNYLGKWYMFGWTFGDLMRDRPTVCTPDDHDVFQGNLWGDGGTEIPIDTFMRYQGTSGGYVQPAQMVNAVHKTQCGHLPDPYDPSPLKQDISAWYTEMIYGKVSFAIISDRIFKSGPEAVATWGGRSDHLKEPIPNPLSLDSEDLEYLGPRQMKFLNEWARNWEDAYMKVLLSQTLFTAVATHHGAERMLLAADLDSGGWPQNKRRTVIDLMRRCFAFHINGDQHIPALVQYGLENHADAGWSFCTPAIAVGYPRAFWPDKLGWSVTNRPDHSLPNTGYYTDGLGNPNFIYAIGNPIEEPQNPDRYTLMQDKASGYGMIHLDTDQQTIQMEAYRFLDEPGQDKPVQFPGWPKTIQVSDNYGRKPVAFLPTLQLQAWEEPVLELVDEQTGEWVYSLRVTSDDFQPKVYSKGPFTIRVGYPEQDQWTTMEGINPSQSETLVVELPK